jgi:hypothetical protein
MNAILDQKHSYQDNYTYPNSQEKSGEELIGVV